MTSKMFLMKCCDAGEGGLAFLFEQVFFVRLCVGRNHVGLLLLGSHTEFCCLKKNQRVYYV